jgi:hypothetical protein
MIMLKITKPQRPGWNIRETYGKSMNWTCTVDGRKLWVVGKRTKAPCPKSWEFRIPLGLFLKLLGNQ